MKTICDTKTLAEFCNSLAAVPFITVDTEFLREKTYWSQLCLVQISGPEEDQARIIDPLAPGIDLSPLFALMQNPGVVKVFHSAGQDIEIFLNLSGAIPQPLFDTQIAAMACGFGDSVSYETLVTQLAHGRIDKTLRFTDWSARPLSDRQLEYALGDVTYLRTIYTILHSRLIQTGRLSWLEEEMAALGEPSSYGVDPAQAWRRLKIKTNKPRVLAILQELAEWREQEARRRDLPRQRIVRDDLLVELALQSPATVDALGKMRGYSKQAAEGEQGSAILAAIARGKARDENDLPVLPDRGADFRRLGPMVDLLRVLLRLRCEQHDVSQKMVASTADLESIAAGRDDGVAALHGWRYDIFGKDALALCQGRLALTLDAAGKRLVAFSR